MQPTSVTYEWDWTVESTPLQGRAVERSIATDTTPVAITNLKVTVFPGTDEPPIINASGRILTKAGKVDRRYSYSQTVWADRGILAEAQRLLAEAQAVSV